MTFQKRITMIVCALFIYGFSQGQPETLNGFDLKGSLIPVKEIMRGGPPRDGIPSIDKPIFLEADEVSYPSGADRVLGVNYNGISKAYPIGIMNYHEIVNDFFGSKPVVISYCPLCGSGIAFEANIEGQNMTFGVSGLLYNSDVLMYDHETETLWSQLMLKAVTGPLKGLPLKVISTVNTTWNQWKEEYPNTKVLSRSTGFRRDYSRTPYTGYDESNGIYFPVSNTSDKYHSKELVTVVEVNGALKAYPHTELEGSEGIVVDKVHGQLIKLKYDKASGSVKVLNPDKENIFHYTTFWFAWFTFNPNGNVYKKR